MFEVFIIIGGIVGLLGGVLAWDLPLLRMGIAVLMILYGFSCFPYPKEDRHKKGLAVGCVIFVVAGILSIVVTSWWPLPTGVVFGFGGAFLLSKEGDYA